MELANKMFAWAEALSDVASLAETGSDLNGMFVDKPMAWVDGVDHTREPLVQVQQMMALLLKDTQHDSQR
jgi:hypothetical protein